MFVLRRVFRAAKAFFSMKINFMKKVKKFFKKAEKTLAFFCLIEYND